MRLIAHIPRNILIIICFFGEITSIAITPAIASPPIIKSNIIEDANKLLSRHGSLPPIVYANDALKITSQIYGSDAPPVKQNIIVINLLEPVLYIPNYPNTEKLSDYLRLTVFTVRTLTNFPIIEINTDSDYIGIRQRYSDALIGYLETLSKHIIRNYNPPQVFLNFAPPICHRNCRTAMPIDALETEEERSAYKAAIKKNADNMKEQEMQYLYNQTFNRTKKRTVRFLKHAFTKRSPNEKQLNNYLRRLQSLPDAESSAKAGITSLPTSL